MPILTKPEEISFEYIFHGKLRIIALPKCGSASLYHTLKDTNATIKHSVGSKYRDSNITEKVVMVVRNPKDRLASCYRYFCKSEQSLPRLSLGMAALGVKVDMDFSDFVDVAVNNLYREEHFIPQSYFCRDRDIDKYMLTENLTEHWNIVAKAIMPTLPDLLHVNRDNELQESDNSIFTDEINAKYEEAYADDIQLYNNAVAICSAY